MAKGVCAVPYNPVDRLAWCCAPCCSASTTGSRTTRRRRPAAIRGSPMDLSCRHRRSAFRCRACEPARARAEPEPCRVWITALDFAEGIAQQSAAGRHQRMPMACWSPRSMPTATRSAACVCPRSPCRWARRRAGRCAVGRWPWRCRRVVLSRRLVPALGQDQDGTRGRKAIRVFPLKSAIATRTIISAKLRDRPTVGSGARRLHPGRRRAAYRRAPRGGGLVSGYFREAGESPARSAGMPVFSARTRGRDLGVCAATCFKSCPVISAMRALVAPSTSRRIWSG